MESTGGKYTVEGIVHGIWKKKIWKFLITITLNIGTYFEQKRIMLYYGPFLVLDQTFQ